MSSIGLRIVASVHRSPCSLFVKNQLRGKEYKKLRVQTLVPKLGELRENTRDVRLSSSDDTTRQGEGAKVNEVEDKAVQGYNHAYSL